MNTGLPFNGPDAVAVSSPPSWRACLSEPLDFGMIIGLSSCPSSERNLGCNSSVELDRILSESPSLSS